MFKHARRLLVTLGMASATLVASVASPAQAQIPYFRSLLAASESKYAAIVVDAKSGQVLYSKHADSPRYPASITKLMTLYLTFEALASGRLHMEDRVAFSPHASAQAPTKLGVTPGESITVADAIQGMVILSANDAAVAMAEKLGGTESRFTALMTLRARELGMENTHFVNANGLPDSRQITTARDLAILSRAIMRDYPQYYHYFSQTSFEFHGRHIQGHNHLLGHGIDGLKTGFTRTSGFNIAISGVANNHRLIVVVMGGPSVASRDQNADDLLRTGFDVMARQDRGERIEVAENLFDRTEEPTGPIQRPPSEQGDADQANLKIVLAENQVPVHTSPIPIVEPKREKVSRAEPNRRTQAKAWSVQVGEFRSHAEAKKQISFVEDHFGDHLGTSFGAAERAGRRYQTRFNGMSESEARLTCRAMKARGLACEVISG